jgi:hypothetical protein
MGFVGVTEVGGLSPDILDVLVPLPVRESGRESLGAAR